MVNKDEKVLLSELAIELGWLTDLVRLRVKLTPDEELRISALERLLKDFTATSKNEDVAVEAYEPQPESFRYSETVLRMASEQYGVALSAEDCQRLQKGQKTGMITTGDGREGKLFVVHTAESGNQVFFQERRPVLILKESYLGYHFTEEDKTNLMKFGDMGKVVELQDKHSPNVLFRGFIGVDRQTRQLTVMRLDSIAGKIKRMRHLKGVPLTVLHKERLLSGAAIRLDGMKITTGGTFSAYVRVSAQRKGLRFDPVR